MILSISFSNKYVFVLFAGLAFLSACATPKELAVKDFHIAKQDFSIAVLPLENLSRSPAPLKEFRQMMINMLSKHGLIILENEVIEQFMARHRIRYTGGIDDLTAKGFGAETGAKAVLVTSLELYDADYPPKIAVISRLISAGDNPAILWADSVAMTGDDSQGILGIGLVEDINILQEKAIGLLSASLAVYTSGKSDFPVIAQKKKKFQPKISYRSPVLDAERKYTIAVIPFSNESGRKYAGDIMVLHFAEQLNKFENFNVIEPGIVRQKLLNLRIIMNNGMSLADADVIFSSLNADLIITGKVIDYQDPVGEGIPKVDFSIIALEHKSREIVWSSKSYNKGDDGVFFFDSGKVNTAHKMASEMVRHIGDMIE